MSKWKVVPSDLKKHHRVNEWYIQDTDATVASHPYGKVVPRPTSYIEEPILDTHELVPVPSHKRKYPSDKGAK
jgi:hypothetical protein